MMTGEYQTELLGVRYLSAATYEASVTRPKNFSFLPGQRVRFSAKTIHRDYTIVSGPQEDIISLCIRHVRDGKFSGVIASASPGTQFTFTGPHGYFRYFPSEDQAVFIATGTGIAPFVSFVHDHVSDFILLHGITDPSEQYYKEKFTSAASLYIPCFSSGQPDQQNTTACFHGRVTRYLETELPSGKYHFYLCGSAGMIADSLPIIDERFPESKVFIESYA
jgi:ferredoxin-NADP reductase